MRILGTRVYPCDDDHRARSVLLSDLHIAREGRFALDALGTLCARIVDDPADTRVLILGDLFDVWVTDAQVRVAQWDRVVALLRSLVAVGVPVTVMHGNRDFMLGARFARATGARVVRGGLRTSLCGRPALLLHGDELCLRDLAYQRARRWLRHPITRAVLQVIPSALALRFAKRARRVSAEVQSRDRQGPGDDPRYEATAEAVATAFAASGCSLLVHGHVHRGARTVLPGGRELLVLPAFDEEGVHLVADGGGLGFRSLSGAERPDFAPRPPR